MTRIYRIYECDDCGIKNEEPAMDWDDEKGCRLCPDCGSAHVHIIEDDDYEEEEAE